MKIFAILKKLALRGEFMSILLFFKPYIIYNTFFSIYVL